MASRRGTILLTGANGSLGNAIVSKILSSPDLATSYHGLYTVRRVDRATALDSLLLRNASTQQQQHAHETVALDLSRLESVREVARSINERVAAGLLPPLRAIILNAAYQEHTTQDFSPDGFDMTFQCNYLSHWLLVLLLLQSLDKEHGRVVVLGSWSHDPLDSRNDSMGAYKEDQWKTIFHDADSLAKGTWSPTKDYPTMEGGFRRYGAGKLCEIMMMYELQRRLDADTALSNITVLGVDPGGMASGLTRRGSPVLVFFVRWAFPLLAAVMTWFSPNGILRPVSKSAADVLRAAFDTAQLGERPKAVYLNGSEIGDTSAEAKDPVKTKQLWEASVGYTALKPGDTILSGWK
ncbi:putative Short-chain dehydrogenase [Colletotrichum higginsianum IMI 349063]|uniref:3beta-hydroxysteroid 3-dehydrogenase n=1 Tax=Colletotrichum higginsianum (strain IMI 349063) TaxID=759273 RepID=A0A1B7YFQ7_COLHI|nr:putative Short-chain dehydrogenase [Colletotrichum higginsianum IMI 349063]OBR10845.1 putative Short-chain dehydrogenase [Colletotrichum higginsianum IMI 349063]